MLPIADDEFLEIQQEVSDIISQLNKYATGMDTEETIEESLTVPATEDPVNNEVYMDEHDKYRRMLPYNTNDPEIQQRQESIIELLISHNICNDENFKIFIAEPDLHKDKASQILDQIYVLDVAVESSDEFINVHNDLNEMPMSPASQIINLTSGLALGSPNEGL